MSRSTFSVLFYANKSKLKNGIVPIMGRVTINGEMRNLFLHINETPIAQWFMEQFGLSQKETQRKGNRL